MRDKLTTDWTVGNFIEEVKHHADYLGYPHHLSGFAVAMEYESVYDIIYEEVQNTEEKFFGPPAEGEEWELTDYITDSMYKSVTEDGKSVLVLPADLYRVRVADVYNGTAEVER